MATSGQLIKVVAGACGLAPVTVESQYRALRVGGLVSKAGRGPSAAKMTVADAVNLIIAVMTSGTADSAPDRVRALRSAKFEGAINPQKKAVSQPGNASLTFLKFMGPRHNFGSALEKIIANFCTGQTVEDTRTGENFSIVNVKITRDPKNWLADLDFMSTADHRRWKLAYGGPNEPSGFGWMWTEITLASNGLRDVAMVLDLPKRSE